MSIKQNIQRKKATKAYKRINEEIMRTQVKVTKIDKNKRDNTVPESGRS